MAALRTNNEKYAVVKHMTNEHPNLQPNYQYKLHRTWRSSLERHIGEALQIDNTSPEVLMNSKSEWGQGSRIPRIIVMRDGETDVPRNPQEHPQGLPQQNKVKRHAPPPESDRNLPQGSKKRIRITQMTEHFCSFGTNGKKPPGDLQHPQAL